MKASEKIQLELEQKRAELRQVLATPASERGDDYAAKRDSLTSDVTGLAADHQAALLSEVGDAEKQQLKVQREQAVNRIQAAQSEAKAVGGFDLKSIREAGTQSAKIHLKDFDAEQIIKGIKSTVTRTTMGTGVSYDELNLKPVRPVSILDLIPSVQTDQPSVNYRRGVVSPSASARAEGQTLSELIVTGEQISDPIQTVGAILHASLEEVEDDAQFSLILQGMMDDVRRELEEQVMIGTGTAPALRGITTTASPQTEAYATSRLYTCLSAKSTLKTTERANPGIYVFRPSDWTLIYGDMIATPGTVIQYVQNGMVPLLHGVPVVEQEDLTSGVGVVMDPSLYAVFYKQGLIMESTKSNGTMFNDLTESFRAYVRAALKTRRLGCRLIDLTA